MLNYVANRLIHWLFFTVALALVPILFGIARYATHGSVPIAHSASEILSRGELILVAAVLCGGAIGELTDASSGVIKSTLQGVSTILLLFCAAYFADVSAAQLAGENLNDAMISTASVSLFGASVVCGSACITASGLL